MGELPAGEVVPEIFPFADEQVTRIARTEPTLRDMLQQFRHLFDHVVYGPDDAISAGRAGALAPCWKSKSRHLKCQMCGST